MQLDVYKDAELVETIELSASKRVYKVGRQQGVADIVLTHGSISREQATLTVSASGTVVVVDLGSAHGTLLSGKRIAPNKPHLLPPGRSLMFGQSTRVFKLRDGGSGFVSTAIGQSDTVQLPPSAAALDDPRVQAALRVLRQGDLACGERIRPDGYLRLGALLACNQMQRAGCTEADLANLPARVSDHIEAATEEGEILLRARSGHAPGARVDVSLVLTPLGFPGFPASDLPGELYFCSTFREWNQVRSHGAGAGRDPPAPIRLCAQAPPPEYRAPSLGGRRADLHVVLRTSSLLAEGLRLFKAKPPPTPPPDATHTLAPVADPECFFCVGEDEADGAVGPWHFARVVNSRDGSEMMGAADVEPLREARRQRAEIKSKASQAKMDSDAARKRQVEDMRKRDAQPQAEPPAKRHNPYLAHRKDEGEEDDEWDA